MKIIKAKINKFQEKKIKIKQNLKHHMKMFHNK